MRTPLTELGRTLTTRQIADVLGVTPATIGNYRRAQHFPDSISPLGAAEFSTVELEEWLDWLGRVRIARVDKLADINDVAQPPWLSARKLKFGYSRKLMPHVETIPPGDDQ